MNVVINEDSPRRSARLANNASTPLVFANTEDGNGTPNDHLALVNTTGSPRRSARLNSPAATTAQRALWINTRESDLHDNESIGNSTVCNPRKKKRHKHHDFYHTVKQKIIIIQEAYNVPKNIRKTAFKYRVAPKSIRDWHGKIVLLKEKAITNPLALTVHIGRQVQAPELEIAVRDWVLDLREEDIMVTTGMVMKKILLLDDNNVFRSRQSTVLKRWVYSFIDRHDLSLRRVTRVGQKLTGHLKEIQVDTCEAIKKRFKSNGTLRDLPLHLFLNMDQTAVYFESKSTKTINKKGARTISCRDSGSNAKRCTVIVTVAADGTKLPLYYVFKGVPGGRIDQELRRDGVLGCAQPRGWFDSETVARQWINAVLVPYLGESEASLLLVDQFKAHMTTLFRRAIDDIGCDLELIPAGYTCVLQPVDVGVNAPLKAGIREAHHEWCALNYRGVANSDPLPTPTRENIMEWTQRSYDAISQESIKKTFEHIGLINQETTSSSGVADASENIEIHSAPFDLRRDNMVIEENAVRLDFLPNRRLNADENAFF